MEDEVKNEEAQEEVKEETKKEAKAKTKEADQKEAKVEAKAPKGDQEEKPLEKMTAPELKEIAKQIPGVTGVTAMKKDELLAIIKEHRGIKDEEPAKKARKKVVKKDLNVKDLKKKVIQLKEEKAAAQKAKDKKQINVLRRRINRAKKRTRKVVHA